MRAAEWKKTITARIQELRDQADDRIAEGEAGLRAYQAQAEGLLMAATELERLLEEDGKSLPDDD